MKKLFNPAIENLPLVDLRRLQTSKMQQQLQRVYRDSPYYRKKFDDAGVNPDNFKSLEQLAEYPFFDKEEERASQTASLEHFGHPLGLHITCDPTEVRRLSSSSGTTGTPTFSGFTQKDRAVTIENMARLMARVNINQGDWVMHAGVLSMWVAGLPPLDALMGAGACVVPMGALSGMERLAQIASVTRPKAVMCTPSFAIHLGRNMLERTGIDPKSLGIKMFMVFGEPGGSIKEIYEEIADLFGGADTFDVMGATGCHSPTGISCEEHAGIHFFAEDNAYFEIVDPTTMMPLPIEDGVEGEIVFTGLDKECGPLIRWRDKDIIRVTTTPCSCGRPGVRMMFKGRVDDMLLVKGVNVFPNAVKDVINRISPRTTGNIRLVKDDSGPVVKAPVKIKVEVYEGATEAELEQLGQQINEAIHNHLRFRAKPIFIPKGGFVVRSGATGKTKLVEIATEESSPQINADFR